MNKNKRIQYMKKKQQQGTLIPEWTIAEKFSEVVEKFADNNAVTTFANLNEFELCIDKNKIAYCCLTWNKWSLVRELRNGSWLIKSTENYNLMCNKEAYHLLREFDGQKTVWEIYNNINKGSNELVIKFIEPEMAYSSENIINAQLRIRPNSLDELAFISHLLTQRGFFILNNIQYMKLPEKINIKPFTPCCKPAGCFSLQSLSQVDVIIIGDKPGTASVGILYLASYLKKHDINAKALFIDGYYTPSDYKSSIINLLQKAQPRFIGISMKWFPHIRKVYETASIIKEYDPSIKVVVGGDTASYYSEQVISHPCIDYLVRGDGEEAFLRICKGNETAPNTYSKQEDKTIPPDDVPRIHIDSHLIDLDEIMTDSSGVLYTSLYLPLSKGCAYNCIQCGGSCDAQQQSYNRAGIVHNRSFESLRKDIISTQKYTTSYMFSISDPLNENYYYFHDMWNGLDLSNHFCALFSTGLFDCHIVELAVKTFKFVRLGIDVCSLSEKHREKMNAMTDGKPQISDNELFNFLRFCEQFENCEVDIYSIAGMPYYTDNDINEEKQVLEKLNTFRCFHSLEWGRLHAQPGALLAEQSDRFEMSSSANSYEHYLDYSNKNYYSDKGYPEMSSYYYPHINYNEKGKTNKIIAHYMEMSHSIKQHKKELLNDRLIPQMISYRNLDELSDHIANCLLLEGLQQQDRVILYIKNRIQLSIAILATIKAGGCYIPLDTQLHKKSIDSVVDQIGASLILSDTEHVSENCKSITVLLNKSIIKQDCYKPTKDSLLYHIFSSGTTDQPKCISIKQSGVINYINWRIQVYGIEKEDVVLQLLSEAFDGFYSNFFTSLLTGSCLIMPSPMQNRDIPFIIKTLLSYKVTHTSVLPFQLKLLEHPDKDNLSTLTTVVLAGDMSDSKFVQRINEKYPELVLINEYGPTENSIATTAYIGMDGKDSSLIGKPISNVQVYIINERGKIADVGTEGEISINGVGLYSGYYPDDSVLFYTSFNEWVYRSGDWGIKNADGDFILIGRIDRQVKISGIPVNLDVLENMLLKNEHISDVAVSYENGSLIANIVLDGHEIPENFTQTIKSKLPFYTEAMVCNFCSSLPRLSVGKINYRELAISYENDDGEQETDSYVEIINTLWKEELGDKKYTYDDNFFDIGGNSLLIMKIHEKLDTLFPGKITITNMFQYYTINMLAEYLSEQVG